MESQQSQFGKIVLLVLLVIIFLALILVPTPELVTYESSGQVSQSIYWRGFEESAVLLDANATYAKIDEQTDYLHVCYQSQHVNSCQEFRILEREGLIATILHLF